MTKVFVDKKDGMYIGFTSSGHSGYAEAGEDIVCSAVSVLVQTALLGILQTVNASAKYTIDERKNCIECTLTEEDSVKREKASLLIEVMYEGLCNVQRNYNKYLRVTEREVK